jgi:hypothetical protein
MNKIIFLIIMFLASNLYAVMPTMRGWIKFDNRIVGSVVHGNISDNSVIARKVHGLNIENYEIGIDSASAGCVVNFYINFYEEDEDEWMDLLDFLEMTILVNSSIIGAYIDVWYSHNDMEPGTCIPDSIMRTIKK